ncbi:GGDEF domain-containing protein [Alteromonas sp. P256]|uniref:GGDEF domain-containing protein n=1 Tax=Alteromonas sp. P256 TaxID=3117399 RepID=UPI002FE16842
MLNEPVDSRISPIAIGDIGAKVEVHNGQHLKSTCTINKLDKMYVCGFRYHFANDVTESIDFTDYSSLTINLSVTGPNNNGSVRLQLTSFNDSYASKENVDTQKYQGVTLDNSVTPFAYNIPLVNFEVESWWLYRYNIGMRDSLAELDKVTGFVIVHNGFSAPGEYRISVNELMLEGRYLSVITAICVLLIFTFIIVVLLIARHRYMLKSQIELDVLTGVLNRSGMNSFLKRQLRRKRKRNTFGVIFIDIDDFKKVNDTYGHDFGDEILMTFGAHCKQFINSCLPPDSVSKLVRVSGDEFVVIVRTTDKSLIELLCRTLCESFESGLLTSIGNFSINISVGGAFGWPDEDGIDTLLKQADKAMYIAKQNGKNQWRVYGKNTS